MHEDPPQDRDDCYPRQDSDSHLAPWRVVGATVCGAGHSKIGTPCQDVHSWEILPTGALFVALADGAGSARYGEVGARIAVQTALCVPTVERSSLASVLSDDDYKLFLRRCFTECRLAVEQEATSRGVPSRELATTLIVFLAQHDLIAAGQIGDGACVVSDEHENVTTLNPPRVGEYVNETAFVSSRNALDELQLSVWRGNVRYVAAFSDGLQSLALKLPEGTPHNRFFLPLFRFVAEAQEPTQSEEELRRFLCSPRIQARSSDDVTLVLAYHA